MKMKEWFQSKQARYGGMSAAITAVFLIVIVLTNIVASVLTDKFPLTADLTKNQIYEISDQSVQFLSQLEKPVKLTVFMDEKQADTDKYLLQFKRVISQYEQYTKNLTVTFIDLLSNPGYASNYADLNPTDYDIIVESDGKTRKVNINDLFNFDSNPYTGETVIISSKADQVLTSAMMGVTSDTAVKAVLLTGHGETVPDGFKNLLTQNNFELEEQNLATEEIDPQADLAIMVGTSRDPDETVLKKLDTFLENGKNYGKTLFYAPATTAYDLPNLDAFLAEWGIEVTPGILLESDAKNIFNATPALCAVEYKAPDYTDGLPANNRFASYAGRELNLLFDTQDGYQTTELLSYYDSAFVVPPDAAEDWAPTDADIHAAPAMIRSSYAKDVNGKPSVSNVLVAASSASLDEMFLTNKSVSNADYLLCAFNTLTNRGNAVTIAPKDLGGDELGLSNMVQAYLLGGIFTLLLPLAVLIAGVAVWLHRRHL
ncbi:GldG family protein [Marasmitruncus massiliensis]|uniref:GldG family protein n=1 Tax=Marasmitruncus massiliensis TaxID=1944642 RepID=UPI000C7A4160|nr:GldG family protein [Marasmitruncus massiliensis]